ncbi:Asp-tRNA(Asn)/Glu-tRNA(Gln) amidotransferase subunit GatC [Kistimonas scapharcae]|uniref:Aspartyl/glutamyl-tRNA(Asn/Gln) amidotransferase subunit C n=1 Tax=Kistimonas scapharcae TaxID=1036133 RepID=A0ABP8UXF7_9GAMM|nr:MAG: asparaginyl/glutamyl-tRNA amidotransferase subunit C [Oceanospirillales bacterium LUC14_002_19_P2]
MAIDRSTISSVAHLARLSISETEAQKTTDNIVNILELINRMQAVDTDGVEPMAHPLDAVQRLRPDVVTETNQREHLQENAPATEDGLFLVPRVIE